VHTLSSRACKGRLPTPVRPSLPARRAPAALTCFAIAAAAIALAATFAFPAPAAAQERSLYWESLDVDARLDGEGRLHVGERQTFVFSGDWNGGERRFEVGFGEKLKLVRLARIDPDTGEERPLVEGDLDQVDHYDWAENRTLRWRSRLPSEPPFDKTRITYLIEYVHEGVVKREGELYHLQHDFAFPDRGGVIERFHLDLEVAPEWRVEGPFRPSFERRDLMPGDGAVVSLPLRYAGEGRPSAVREPLPFAVRAGACAALAVGFSVLLGLFLSDQARLGRFSRPRSEIDRAWIEQHLLAQRPEEVGALWDRRMGPPEVAALLARLVAEGKLESRVEEKRGLFGKPVLHLKLLAERSDFTDYERSLLDKLFWGGRSETDTEQVREHYRRSGFNPAAAISAGIERRLKRQFPAEASGYRPPARRPTAVLFFGGLACLALAAASHLGTAVAVLFILGMVYLGPYGIAAAGAVSWRQRIERLVPASLVFILPILAICGLTVVLLLFEELFGFELAIQPGLAATAALVLLPLAVTRHLLNLARSRESAETIERRQLLAAARRWLAGELGRREPRLEDAWYPYLLALGLQTHVQRWFRAFGGATAGMTAASTAGWSGGGAGGISSSGGWSGGGGAFGGGGGSAAWGVAAAGLSAGVSAPSSSGGGSSGGGGGGGGSSGGGGGGGW
jgi:uncharacterized membrane protein YgcG